MAIKRRPFQGVLNILSFNRHSYYWGLRMLAAVVLSRWIVAWPSLLFWIVVGAFIYGLVMPLLVIEERFPGARLRVFDFYDAERHTEAAIVRARRVSLVYPDTRVIASDAIPMADGSVDVVFLLSAIHEIRL
jgi:hypothetical protein